MAFCQNCGKQINDDDAFCTSCGTAQPAYPERHQAPISPTNKVLEENNQTTTSSKIKEDLKFKPRPASNGRSATPWIAALFIFMASIATAITWLITTTSGQEVLMKLANNGHAFNNRTSPFNSSEINRLSKNNFCNDKNPSPIDIQLQQELNLSNGVTADIRDAQGRAHESWDKELNKEYKNLMNLLSPKEQSSLRKAQRAWLSFRDAESDFWWSESISDGGSLGPIIVSDYDLDLVRERTCQLSRYRKKIEPRQ